MCGIAGVYGWTDQDELREMLSRITDRGPDDEGRYVDDDGPMMMGARRLSIIDLAEGGQPIYNEDGSVVVVFNGEIYNHEQLREDLENQGHRLSTECDTEVLVHLWEEYGTNLPKHLNGMFAFSIWDEDAETLFLARDRLGIKPLYYADTTDGFVWGSELPALLPAGIERTLDERAVYNYFSLRYSPWPQTLLSGVQKLRPGSSLTVTADGVQQREYWNLQKKGDSSFSGDPTEEVLRRLRESVQSRMMADVPLGAFLSGGLDSSAIVGLMSEISDDVKTFSIAFENERFDESSEAKYVSEYFGTDHHEYTADLSSMDLFEDIATYFGEPLADPAVVPTMLLSKHASDEVKVVLTGEGADELFLGYDYYEMVPQHRQLADRLPSFVFDVASLASKNSPIAAGHLDYLSSLRNDEEALVNWSIGYGTPPDEYMETDLSPTESGLRELISGSYGDKKETLERMESLYMTHWLCDDLLYKVDHSTMAASLEARVPFLDHTFVEFAHSISASRKLETGEYKSLLNDALKGIVPPRVREREKQGFSVPIGKWLKSDNSAIRRWLDRETIADTPYLDPQQVSKFADRHQTGEANHSSALWRILNYTAWYHTIIAESDVGRRTTTTA